MFQVLKKVVKLFKTLVVAVVLFAVVWMLSDDPEADW